MEGNASMTTAEFRTDATVLGTPTDQTLAEFLGTTPDSIAENLRPLLDRIREAEREADRSTAEVRLY